MADPEFTCAATYILTHGDYDAQLWDTALRHEKPSLEWLPSYPAAQLGFAPESTVAPYRALLG